MSEIISDTEGALAVQVDYDLEDSSRNEAEPKETESFEIKTEHFEIGSVDLFLELFKVGKILKKSGNPRNFVIKIQGLTQKLSSAWQSHSCGSVCHLGFSNQENPKPGELKNELEWRNARYNFLENFNIELNDNILNNKQEKGE